MRRKKGLGCLGVLLVVFVMMCCALVILCLQKSKFDVSALTEKQQKKEIPYQEITIAEDDLSYYYYYQQLGDEEKLIYKEILQGVEENVPEIYTHATDADRANALFQYVMKDCPWIFWCDGAVTSTSFTGEESYTVLKPTYQYDAQQKETMKSEIDNSVKECLAGISQDASDYQKILYVYEYIVNTVDYDMEALDNQNIYSVFVRKRSVCAGYSKAMQYLLSQLNVFCTYVTGTTTGGQQHAWNLVKCEGDYYYVDITWGDPLFQAAEGEEILAVENITYDYMCCDDTELFKNHTPDSDMALPECSKMDWNYYVVNGMYHWFYDRDEILNQMNEVIASGSNPVVIKFANQQLYEEAYDDIFQNLVPAAAQNLADWYGISEVRYQYLDENELNKITIYWQYE